MDEQGITLAEVQELLVERVAAVLGLDDAVDLDARFDEDLHADSLDLVEVIEAVERRLAARGAAVALDDEQLLSMKTVREAADRIHAAAAPGA